MSQARFHDRRHTAELRWAHSVGLGSPRAFSDIHNRASPAPSAVVPHHEDATAAARATSPALSGGNAVGNTLKLELS